MDYKEKYEQALERARQFSEHPLQEDSSNIVEYIFPELAESEDEVKPNSGIVMEDFNEGNGFYKVNLAYLNKEQVEEIEELVKKWNPELAESKDKRIRDTLIEFFRDWGTTRSHCWGAAIPDILAWLEKQGEQKPFDYEHATIQQRDFAPKFDSPILSNSSNIGKK